nr:AAA family ATPase [uncultured Shimia sp.]
MIEGITFGEDTVTDLHQARNMQRSSSIDLQHLVPFRPSVPAPHGLDRLLGNIFARGLVTVIAGIGGVSKSTFLGTLAISCVTGCPLIGPTPREPRKVLYLGIEDDQTANHRMFQAICEEFKIKDDDIKAKLDILGSDTIRKVFQSKELDYLTQMGPVMPVQVNPAIHQALDVLIEERNRILSALTRCRFFTGALVCPQTPQTRSYRALSCSL